MAPLSSLLVVDLTRYMCGSQLCYPVVGGALVNVAGGGQIPGPAYGVPATQILVSPSYISAAADGALYIADSYRILKVTPDGLAWNVYGGVASGYQHTENIAPTVGMRFRF